MKYTVEYLKSLGYTGYQRNTMTGYTLDAEYVLKEIAQAASEKPEFLRFVHDNLGGKVRVFILNGWKHRLPASTQNLYAERAMTAAELERADAELRENGLCVIRGCAK